MPPQRAHPPSAGLLRAAWWAAPSAALAPPHRPPPLHAARGWPPPRLAAAVTGLLPARHAVQGHTISFFVSIRPFVILRSVCCFGSQLAQAAACPSLHCTTTLAGSPILQFKPSVCTCMVARVCVATGRARFQGQGLYLSAAYTTILMANRARPRGTLGCGLYLSGRTLGQGHQDTCRARAPRCSRQIGLAEVQGGVHAHTGSHPPTSCRRSDGTGSLSGSGGRPNRASRTCGTTHSSSSSAPA